MRFSTPSTLLLSFLSLIASVSATPAVDADETPVHKPCFKKFSNLKLGLINTDSKHIRNAGTAKNIPVSIDPQLGTFTGLVSDDGMKASRWDFFQCELDWVAYNNSKTISVGQFRPAGAKYKKRITLFEMYWDNPVEWLKLDYRSNYYFGRRRDVEDKRALRAVPQAFTWILHLNYYGKVHAADFAVDVRTLGPNIGNGSYYIELKKPGAYSLWGEHRPFTVNFLQKGQTVPNGTINYKLALSP